MKKSIVFLGFFFIIPTFQVLSQSCQQKISDAEVAEKRGDYLDALRKYNAARKCDPKMDNKVEIKIELMFKKIDQMRKDALKAKRNAEKALLGARADKNINLYIGVDNPITIFSNAASFDKIEITTNGLTLTKENEGKYIATATRPGYATITISGEGIPTKTDTFRIKRIPDPVPMLGGQIGANRGVISNGEFKAQGGIAAILKDFDFDARCDIVSFEVCYIEKRSNSICRTNNGARFNIDILELIKQAKPGDLYIFSDIKARCPGDAAPRDIGSLTFKIR